MEGRKRRLHKNLSFLTLTDTKKQTSAPISPRNFEAPNGVVGLGILAALNGDLHHHHHQDQMISSGSRTGVVAISPKSASNPIPIIGNKNVSENNCSENLSAEKMELCEGYTCVMSHVGKNQIKKREYFEAENLWNNNESPIVSFVSGNGDCSAGDFLSSCFLCEKMLHGLDVFMYRGEKAFCSAECRHRQISLDEQRENRPSGVRRSTKHSISPCSVAAA